MTNSRYSSVKGKMVISLIKMLAWLPLPVSKMISEFVSWIIYYSNSTSRKVTETNLALCFPDFTTKERDNLTRESINSTGQLLTEMARIWIRPVHETLSMIQRVEGEEILTKPGVKQGIILITPHIGNWELIYQYLLPDYPVSALYRPPKIADLDTIIRKGREKIGGQMIKTSQMEVRKMLKVLKKAELLIILPDQQPQQGSGVFAPFYGHQAYTMTLLQGLAKRTNARIVMVTCIRTKAGFVISFNDPELDVSTTREQFASALNLSLQQQIDKYPEQYQWAYKRFKACPEGVTNRYNK